VYYGGRASGSRLVISATRRRIYAIGLSVTVLPRTPSPFVGTSLADCALRALTPSFPLASPTGALPGVSVEPKTTDGLRLEFGRRGRSKSDSADGPETERTKGVEFREPSMNGADAGG
jgi:hypothetical protein